MRTAAGELLVRARGRAEDVPDFANLTVRTETDGSRLTLGEIAEIRDGLIEKIWERKDVKINLGTIGIPH